MRQAVTTFHEGSKTLPILLPEAPGQRADAQRIEMLEGSREERIYGTIGRFRSHAVSPQELRTLLRTAEQERLAIEARLHNMQAEANRLAGGHMARGDRLSSAARLTAWSCALGLTVLLAAVWRLVDGGVLAGIGRLKEQVARLAAAGPTDSSSEDRSELDTLAETVGRGADLLDERTHVLDLALHGIARIDHAGRFLSHNQAFGELLGVPDWEAPDQLLSIIHGDDWDAVEAAREAAWTGTRQDAAARLVRPCGPTTDVVISFVKAGEDTSRGEYVLIRNNSRQRQRESELIGARNAAVEANASKTRFPAKVTHDIRTPLNAILGASALLSQTSLNAEQFEYVSMFQRNSERLVELINDFLDFAKIEAGAVRVDKVPFRVRQAVGDVIKTFRESAVRKGLALDMAVSPELPEWQMGDPLRVQQVLVNLVSNSVKFTASGRIDVKALVRGSEKGDRLCFEVSDTGPGIRAADREKIFTPFTQLVNMGSNGNSGSGLGLAICRELTQLMDGELGLRDEVGLGSTFYFSIPLLECEPAPQVATRDAIMSESAKAPGGRIRILAAEDAEDSRFLLDRYLRHEPVALRMVKDGCEAVEAVESGEEFDLILMDIDMPCMDGRTATKRIREWQARVGAAPTAIVALSAFAVQTEVRASLDAGCTAHVVKPIDQATLIGTVRRYAGHSKSDDGETHDSEVLRQGVAQLVPGYLAAQARRIDDATIQLATRDFESIQRFGHNLKGTAIGYGFPEIEKLGSAIEAAAAKSDVQSVAEQLMALDRAVSEAATAVSQPV